MRLVQIARRAERRVALVDDSTLRLLDRRIGVSSIYALAMQALQEETALTKAVESAVGNETLEYDAVYERSSPWRLLPSFDHPEEASRCMVSGTGLTHKASAENRANMHTRANAEITDSFRLYQMGLEGGNPEPGQIGVQPEWFYKGDGTILRADGETLTIPNYGWDGGEEPEIAGAYVVSREGEPFRVGLTVGNEFSDHRMEKKNYLYLAHSKLRDCAIGPELNVGPVSFQDVPGTVKIVRDGQTVWSKDISTGQKNMSYSVSNLEHHHFKYAAHRRPGYAHIHFFGADAFSFGDGVVLQHGDTMEISFPRLGRALRNQLVLHRDGQSHITVRIL
jgi:hypothetical protein